MKAVRKNKTHHIVGLTARKSRLEEVNKSKQREQFDEKVKAFGTCYRRLFETAQDGILIIDSMTGQIIDVNRSFIDMLGYPYEDLSGKCLWETDAFRDVTSSKDIFLSMQQKDIHYQRCPVRDLHVGL